MRNTNKKGFTIVELVIVVAVIAILAAVLIPTFSGIIRKANLSADQVAVKNMNTVLATEFATVTPASIKEVVDALDDNGFNVDALTPLSKDHKFCWNVGTKTIVLVDANNTVLYPEKEELKSENVNLADGASYINVEASTPEAVIEALKSGSDVTLMADVTLPDEPVTIKGNVTIDLNGHNLNASASTTRPFVMSGDSILTINATNSVVDCGIFGIVNIVDDSNAKLVINGGTFKGDLRNGAFLRIRNNVTADITLNNVTFVDAHEKYASEGDSYFIDKNSGSTVNLTVNGGNFTGYMGFINISNATIKNATINTTGVAIVAHKGEVSGCKINVGSLKNNAAPTSAVATWSNGEVSVSNCTITTGGENDAFAIYSSGGTIIANGNNLSTFGIYKDNVTYPDAEYLVKIDGTSYTE